MVTTLYHKIYGLSEYFTEIIHSNHSTRCALTKSCMEKCLSVSESPIYIVKSRWPLAVCLVYHTFTGLVYHWSCRDPYTKNTDRCVGMYAISAHVCKSLVVRYCMYWTSAIENKELIINLLRILKFNPTFCNVPLEHVGRCRWRLVKHRV